VILREVDGNAGQKSNAFERSARSKPEPKGSVVNASCDPNARRLPSRERRQKGKLVRPSSSTRSSWLDASESLLSASANGRNGNKRRGNARRRTPRPADRKRRQKLAVSPGKRRGEPRRVRLGSRERA
jgi:hypothetical protein